ncbi:ent-kaurene synthase, partial [Genlisea aurea]
QCLDETRERIAKLLKKPEVSISTYDTAWVAMVPSQNSSSKDPFFKGSLNWLLENQCPDGSWALPHHHDLLRKDVLSSTLACVLALKKWGVGAEQLERGAHFIESNFTAAFDDRQWSPIGFDIVFPAMLEHARDLSLMLDLEPTSLNALFSKRDLELNRYFLCCSVGYLAEGMGKSFDWTKFMQYQHKNGSFFNCPSTTAAAYIAFPNANCLNYLQSVVNKFGNAVPALYPLDMYLKLSTVDSLEKLGISRYFKEEIHDVLDEAYRHWVQGSDEILMDASTCALAFRLLRMNEYNVTSAIRDWFSCSSHGIGNVRDIQTCLELYKASELILHPDEYELETQKSRLKHLLEQEISARSTESIQSRKNIRREVNHAIKYPFFAILDGMSRRTSIEHYNSDCTRILKTSY